MAGISGQGTTFGLPNFVGELFNITPTDTPILSAIGGLTGGEEVQAKIFEWEYFDLRTAGNTAALEGANAPTAQERIRAYDHAPLQIFQEAVEVTYTKQAAIGQLDVAVLTAGSNPVTDEMGFQVDAALKSVARDVEWAFINQTSAEPADNVTPRKMKGLLEAITTNVKDMSGADLSVDAVLDSMQSAWENGGLQEGETRTLVTNATLKRALTTLFIKDQNFRQMDRNVGGVNVTSIETDFGDLNVMLDRHMPVTAVLILSLEDLAPVFLRIPGKGHLFVEDLAKNGSADRKQIYGEIGLKYGNQRKHALIKNASGSIS